jgi:hypothetical protein
MPKSKNRKGHKEKAQAYKKNVELEKKKAKEKMMKLYMEQMKAQTMSKRHVDGEFIENSDIEVDIDNFDNLEIVETENIDNIS